MRRRPVIAHLAELKQTSDLHSDQLSQAVLLRFAESGELARHLVRTRQDGQLRLIAARNACAANPFARQQVYDSGRRYEICGWNCPGGSTLRDLLAKVQEQGVAFLPGHYFSVERANCNLPAVELRGLSPDEIRRAASAFWVRPLAGNERLPPKTNSNRRRRWYELKYLSEAKENRSEFLE